MNTVGGLIVSGIIILGSVPFVMIGAWIKHSNVIRDRNHFESENVELELRMSWHKRRIEELEWDAKINAHNPLSSLPAMKTELVSAAPLVMEADPELIIDENQLVLNLEVEQPEPTMFTPAKIEGMQEAQQPDMDFVKRLNASPRASEHGKVIEFPSMLKTEVPFTIEVDEVEQVEMELSIENKLGYSWTEGQHLLHFQVVDHHGHDLALCEIIGNGSTTMLQHSKLAGLDNGDQFVASILIKKGRGREVQKLWTTTVPPYELREAEG